METMERGGDKREIHPRDLRVSVILLALGTAVGAYFTLATSWYLVQVDGTFSLEAVTVPDRGPSVYTGGSRGH